MVVMAAPLLLLLKIANLLLKTAVETAVTAIEIVVTVVEMAVETVAAMVIEMVIAISLLPQLTSVTSTLMPIRASQPQRSLANSGPKLRSTRM